MQLADYGGPYPGNFISSLQALDRRLSSIGSRQVLVFSDVAKDRIWLQDLMDKGRRVYLLPRNGSRLMLAYRIGKIAERENVSVMHTHFSTFDMPAVGAQGLIGSKGKKVRLFRHVHSAFPVRPTIVRKLKDLIKFRMFGDRFHSIYVSDALHAADVFRGLNSSRFDILPNGVDMTRLLGTSELAEGSTKAYGLKESTENLLMFGWDPITKGVDLALKACLRLAEENRNFSLILVGEHRLIGFVEDFFTGNIPLWVKILPPEQNVAKLYSVADIFVSASRYEGFPYAVCEAMAAGIPIIASDIEGLRWARKAPNVDFFKTEDSNDLASRLRAILNMEPHLRKNVYSNNKNFILENYSVEKWADKLVDIYMKTL